MDQVIQNIRAALIANADERTKISGERFFKEEVNLYGIKTAVVIKLAKEHFKLLPNKDKSTVFGYCEQLFKSGVMEESFVACNWSCNMLKQYQPADFGIFERWVTNYVGNWATCDTLCNHTVGAIVEMYPELISGLRNWAHSENRWVKRASAVSLIIPARNGLFLDEIFGIADILLADRDDMVQKGYGWMLKAASQAHLNEVFGYVMKNKAAMPRTSLRYAIEKMPSDMKAAAMKK
ncbi:MAG TPA: DNA alkylation repair protein [Bacteroidales bacterium]|nr:DNA alkylation repair protein [Bacteroidales bacterium]